MKKVRDIPTNCNIEQTQTQEYQERLRTLLAEDSQVELANHGFLDGKEDDGHPLNEMDYEILTSCTKPIPDNLDDKHSIYEEGDDVSYSYGILTLRGLIVWKMQSGKWKSWIVDCAILD